MNFLLEPLNLVTFFPLVGVLVILFIKSENKNAIRWTALITSLVTFGISLWVLSLFQPAQTGLQLVYDGLWFTPTREAIDAFVATIQPKVTGDVRLRLFKGECRIVGRRSAHALYDHALATYDAGDRFDHTAAEGFIKIWGLPIETSARKARSAAPQLA